jgi:hypothetical protein
LDIDDEGPTTDGQKSEASSDRSFILKTGDSGVGTLAHLGITKV